MQAPCTVRRGLRSIKDSYPIKAARHAKRRWHTDRSCYCCDSYIKVHTTLEQRIGSWATRRTRLGWAFEPSGDAFRDKVFYQVVQKALKPPHRLHWAERLCLGAVVLFKYAPCYLCGTGCGVIECPECKGQGVKPTRPGGAGVPMRIGLSLCKQCRGQTIIPCQMCAGIEAKLPQPEPDKRMV